MYNFIGLPTSFRNFFIIVLFLDATDVVHGTVYNSMTSKESIMTKTNIFHGESN